MVIDRLWISQRMIERLLKLLADDLKQTLGEVARMSGVEYDTLSQIRAGRVKSMRCDTLAAIIKAYPSINANYILTGEGERLLNNTGKLDAQLTDDVRAAYEASGRALKRLGGGIETLLKPGIPQNKKTP